MRLALLLAFALGCKSEPQDAEREPIVVYWTIDTLGMIAAEETGFCERMNEVLAPRGRDLACLDGAVPASSWTQESHVRTLWPQHLAGSRQALEIPELGTQSFLRTLAVTEGLDYLFASDNATFRTDGPEALEAWTQDVDEAWVFEEFERSIVASEPETAVHRGLDGLLARAEEGKGLAVYLNDFEAGGHGPRCVHDPYTEECEVIWQQAISLGIVTPDADRATEFLEKDLLHEVSDSLVEEYGEDVEGLRTLYWGTITDAIYHFREDRFVPRLEKLVEGLESRGRLEDLTLIVAGDHGENPCMEMAITDRVNCGHFGLQNGWTGRVPVTVSPAEVAEEWVQAGIVGSEGTPWALPNLAWATLHSQGVEAPSSWPEMMPVGTATSWVCHNGTSSGIRIEGNVSVRCEGKSCGAFEWAYPTALTDEPVPLDSIPDEMQVWAANTATDANAFEAACAGLVGW